MREKKEINIQIGENIRLARVQARLTQEQFTERIEVSPQYVSDLERGVVGISIPTLKRACIALGATSDQILFGEKNKIDLDTKCATLSDAELGYLLNIIDNYVTALTAAHRRSEADI